MISISEILDEAESCTGTFASDVARGDVLYPQANSLGKVLEVVRVLRETGMSVYDLVKTGIVHSSRQARYYYNAAAFLGFCYRRGDYFYPTELASELLGVPEMMQQQRFAAFTLENELVSPLYIGLFRYADKESRLKWIEKNISHGIVAQATLRRRASCLHAWMAWIQQNLPKIKE